MFMMLACKLGDMQIPATAAETTGNVPPVDSDTALRAWGPAASLGAFVRHINAM